MNNNMKTAVLLAGLVLNATLGWSWAEPIAGLVIAAVAVREGLEAWRGENCGCGPTLATDPSHSAEHGQGSDSCCGDGSCSSSEGVATVDVATIELSERGR